ncbi:MAG TPA: DUF1599 domain-containing protein [Flavitalea sp.]|nr:DUF1599 domain-containing protein [Flavitalea sp.]
MSDTLQQYDAAIASCKEIFIKKTKDYGTSWRVLRPISIVDQILIKVLRIRSIQEKGAQRVADNITDEFRGIVNYCIIGLIQLSNPSGSIEDLPAEQVEKWYDAKVMETQALMQAKNHDYDEAWRRLSQESFVDLILMKLMRMRQILANDGRTLISEGMEANYQDIINYAVFALIMREDAAEKQSP